VTSHTVLIEQSALWCGSRLQQRGGRYKPDNRTTEKFAIQRVLQMAFT
jgi:hypothetical protein